KQYPGVPHAVAQAIKYRFVRSVTHSKCFKPSHHYTVSNDEANKRAEYFVHRVVVRFQDLCNQGNQGCYNRQLHNDTDAVGNIVTYQGDYKVRKRYDGDN